MIHRSLASRFSGLDQRIVVLLDVQTEEELRGEVPPALGTAVDMGLDIVHFVLFVRSE